jgi:hypothetical protein
MKFLIIFSDNVKKLFENFDTKIDRYCKMIVKKTYT